MVGSAIEIGAGSSTDLEFWTHWICVGSMWYNGWFGLEERGGGGRFGLTMGWGFDGGWKDVTIVAGWRQQL
ncbi:unnamed protein product [Prunus armeniaca]|uniref:Uncharacterized protein n=1 Tax=Prunus armeniaca TaxID=36596 RepID=A0A6J5UMW9_PRUAR|nr:unnamed protein product [Prunus armeniaca]CAB4308307.1 unnamed protein product [Prunus armeniaca]